MNFIGNEKAVHFLQKTLEKGHTSHAYIFSGPEHVGKFLLAKMFAEALILGKNLNAENTKIDQTALFDMVIVEPEVTEKNNVTKQRDITVEAVREIQKTLSLFPYHGKKKVLIVSDAHKLNIAAQNALLKTLEEPSETSVIILVTHEADKLLSTIHSRCVSLSFGLAGGGKSVMGRPGLFEIYQKDADSEQAYQEAANLLQKFPGMGIGEKIKLAETMSKDVVRTLAILAGWIWFLREGVKDAELGKKRQTYLAIDKIENLMNLLKSTNANARLALEALFLEI